MRFFKSFEFYCLVVYALVLIACILLGWADESCCQCIHCAK